MRDWEPLTALAEESLALSAVLLDAEVFERPTNCPPWDLKELVVHTAASIGLWTVTRVISVAAHGVDVALTLRRTPWMTPPA